MTTKEIQAAILKSCVHAYQGIKIRAANGVKVRTIKAGQLIGALTAEVFELIKCLSFGQNELVGGNADNDAITETRLKQRRCLVSVLCYDTRIIQYTVSFSPIYLAF